MNRIRRVLHPTDFSRASSAAYRRAIELAKANRAELMLLHVLSVPVPVTGDGYMPPKIYEEIVTGARAYGQKQLDALVRKAHTAGARATGLLVEGIAHERIAQIARSKKADVLVVGTHGRTGLQRFFLGSVASRVLALAPCPVLTVRGK
jgi:nucleotide-binding universal stress UspA family protein